MPTLGTGFTSNGAKSGCYQALLYSKRVAVRCRSKRLHSASYYSDLLTAFRGSFNMPGNVIATHRQLIQDMQVLRGSHEPCVRVGGCTLKLSWSVIDHPRSTLSYTFVARFQSRNETNSWSRHHPAFVAVERLSQFRSLIDCPLFFFPPACLRRPMTARYANASRKKLPRPIVPR